MKENRSCNAQHCSQGPDLGTLKGHPNVLVQSRVTWLRVLHTHQRHSPCSPGARPGDGPCPFLCPGADPPRLPLPPLVCSSHLVFQPNDTWSCPLDLFVVFRSKENSAPSQPSFWSLQVALPPLLPAQPPEFPADTSLQCQHRWGTILAQKTEWIEVTHHWGKKEGYCSMAMDFASERERQKGVWRPWPTSWI